MVIGSGCLSAAVPVKLRGQWPLKLPSPDWLTADIYWTEIVFMSALWEESNENSVCINWFNWFNSVPQSSVEHINSWSSAISPPPLYHYKYILIRGEILNAHNNRLHDSIATRFAILTYYCYNTAKQCLKTLQHTLQFFGKAAVKTFQAASITKTVCEILEGLISC